MALRWGLVQGCGGLRSHTWRIPWMCPGLRRGSTGRHIAVIRGNRRWCGMGLRLWRSGRCSAEHLDHPATNAASTFCRRGSRGRIGRRSIGRHLAGGRRRCVSELRARLRRLRSRRCGAWGLGRRLWRNGPWFDFLDRPGRWRRGGRLPLVGIVRSFHRTCFSSRDRSFRRRDLSRACRWDRSTGVEIGSATGTARKIVADSRITSGTDLRHPTSPAR